MELQGWQGRNKFAAVAPVGPQTAVTDRRTSCLIFGEYDRGTDTERVVVPAGQRGTDTERVVAPDHDCSKHIYFTDITSRKIISSTQTVYCATTQISFTDPIEDRVSQRDPRIHHDTSTTTETTPRGQTTLKNTNLHVHDLPTSSTIRNITEHFAHEHEKLVSRFSSHESWERVAWRSKQSER